VIYFIEEVVSMTVTMTAKNQITIPKKIANALGLCKGTMFEVEVFKSGIELIPLETKEREFADTEYAKLEFLETKEKGKESENSGRKIKNKD